MVILILDSWAPGASSPGVPSATECQSPVASPTKTSRDQQSVTTRARSSFVDDDDENESQMKKVGEGDGWVYAGTFYSVTTL